MVNAPERLREQLRALATDQLLARCARLRSHPTQPIEHRATIIGLRRTAQRALALQAEADDLQAELDGLVDRLAPGLLAEPGIGVICAAQLLTAWSHPGRLRSEAAFHTIVLSRMTYHAQTRAYVARRTAEGKTPREIKRCLKRYLARRLFKLLETSPAPVPNAQIATA